MPDLVDRAHDIENVKELIDGAKRLKSLMKEDLYNQEPGRRFQFWRKDNGEHMIGLRGTSSYDFSFKLAGLAKVNPVIEERWNDLWDAVILTLGAKKDELLQCLVDAANEEDE